MPKYLLSNGKVTKSKITYIKDCIYIELNLIRDDIPYSTAGISELTGSIKTTEVNASIHDVVNDLIFKLSKLVNADIQLIDITMYSDIVEIKLKINGIETTYEIQR